jgi:hypothetical protein
MNAPPRMGIPLRPAREALDELAITGLVRACITTAATKPAARWPLMALPVPAAILSPPAAENAPAAFPERRDATQRLDTRVAPSWRESCQVVQISHHRRRHGTFPARPSVSHPLRRPPPASSPPSWGSRARSCAPSRCNLCPQI